LFVVVVVAAAAILVVVFFPCSFIYFILPSLICSSDRYIIPHVSINFRRMTCTVQVGQEETQFDGYLHSVYILNLRTERSLLETLRPTREYRPVEDVAASGEAQGSSVSPLPPVYIMSSILSQENANLLELSFHCMSWWWLFAFSESITICLSLNFFFLQFFLSRLSRLDSEDESMTTCKLDRVDFNMDRPVVALMIHSVNEIVDLLGGIEKPARASKDGATKMQKAQHVEGRERGLSYSPSSSSSVVVVIVVVVVLLRLLLF
jgi:hypothetical protein